MMKCPKCGMELRKNVKFCRRCGEPIKAAPSRRKNDEDSYETMSFKHPTIGTLEYKSKQVARPAPAPVSREPIADRMPPAAAPRNRRAVFESMAPPVAPPAAAPMTTPPAKKKPVGIIVAVVAVLLAAAIGVTAFFIWQKSGQKTQSTAKPKLSEEAVKDAKEGFAPPAQSIEIDPAAEDPSNENITFTFDDKSRILTCSYTVNKKTYDQTYEYDDDACLVVITTAFKGTQIDRKEIGYQQVSEPNVTEAVDGGYYLRLDEESFALVNELSIGSGPQGLATEAPASDSYKEQYLSYLENANFKYTGGQLFYLNDDDIPELSLQLQTVGANAITHQICWISGGEVQHYDVTARSPLYAERSGSLKAMYQLQSSGGFTEYTFDGATFTKGVTGTWTYAANYGNSAPGKRYLLNGSEVTEAEYNAKLGETENLPCLYPSPVDKEGLPNYIRDFN